jgi:hypothetical protein
MWSGNISSPFFGAWGSKVPYYSRIQRLGIPWG